MNYKNIIGLVPGLQATSLVAANVKALPKVSPKSKVPPLKKTIKLGVNNIVGVGLTGATAKAVNALWLKPGG